MPAARLVFGGAAGTGDKWSCGLWVDIQNFTGGTPTSAELTAFAGGDVATALENWWATANGPAARNAAGFTLVTATIYWYTALGGPLASQGSGAVGGGPGTGTNPHPAYVSMAVSLHTAVAGRSGRGRIYVPATAGIVTSPDMQFQPLDVQTYLDATTKLVRDLNGLWIASSGVGDGTVGVYSRKLAAINPIVSLSCDSIPDTQHGREDKYQAKYNYVETVAV